MPETGEQIVATLLRALPGELAERVLARFKPELAAQVRERMAAPAEPDQLQHALRELSDLRRMVERPVPTVKTEQPVGDAKDAFPTPQQISADPVKALRSLTPEQLIPALRGEEPALIAAVLACLESTAAGEMLKRLPPAVRSDVALRLSRPIEPSRDVIGCLTAALVERCRSCADAPEEPLANDRVARTATVLRALPRTERMELFGRLEAADPETAAEVVKQLYQFDDLLRIESRSLQAMLADADLRLVARAISGADDAIVAKVQNSLSSRAREALSEIQGLFGKLPQSEIDGARTTLLETLRKLDFEGKLTFE